MIFYALFPKVFRASASLYNFTLFPAFKKVAEHFDIEYMPFEIDGDWADGNEVIEKLPSIEDEVIFITTYNNGWTREHYDSIKSKMPNAKMVWLGSDTHYDGKTESGSLVGLENIQWPLDLYLDTMKDVVTEASSLFPSEHYYWSISESIIDLIDSFDLNTAKKYDSICLCSTDNGSSVRKEMFQALDEAGLWVLRNLNEHNLETILNFYSQSWTALGTTTPCMNSDLRSMKGFRDWIAPFCGTVLIYDNFPDILDIGSFVPIYKYEDWDDAARVIKELKTNSYVYDLIIKKQKQWALENTLEKQLIRIFKKHLL